MSREDIITVGATKQGHDLLDKLKQDEIFLELVDGYRFAIGLAIARRIIAPPGTKMTTIFNVGSLDPDGSMRSMISELYSDGLTAPYTLAERLAEAGLSEMAHIR